MLKKFDSYDGLALCGGLVFYAPVALLVRTQAGVTVSQFFLLQALLSAVTFFGEVPAGLITEKVGYQRTLVLSQIAVLAARTLLMLAFLFRCPVLLLPETVLMGLGCCFASGTGEAYVYEVYGPELYLSKAAQTGNWGTAGFLLSTVLYVPLYRSFGIPGLLAATVAASTVQLCFALALPKETGQASPVGSAPSLARLWQVMKRGKVLIALSSVFSVTGILVNFFYAEKLRSCGVDLAWMSPIIFAYSGIQMLSKVILDRLRHGPKHRVLGAFCGLAALMLMAFGLTDRPLPVIAMMILLPLVLSIPGYCLGDQENALIDAAFGGENRAASLSVLSMGCDLVEILALFSTALLAGRDPGMCFTSVGIVLLGFGLRFIFHKG